jgi:hypothetical protein
VSNISNHDPIVPQDLGLDDADVNDLGIPEALSQDEIEELINSPTLAAGDRLSRLIELREHLTMRAASEFGDNDAASLLGEVERGIAALQTDLDNITDEPEAYTPLDAAIDIDPLEHRETLAPDDDDLLDLEDEEDDDEDDDEEDDDEVLQAGSEAEDDLNEVLDPTEWESDDDGFDSEKGVN